MRFFLIFLFFSIFSIQAQEHNSPITLHIKEVEVPPVFPGCEEEEAFMSCSGFRVVNLFMEEIDPLLLFSLKPEEGYLNLRFIVDNTGKVVKPMVQTKNKQVEAVATEIIQNLPLFRPGYHKEQAVNVIIDLPLQLKPNPDFNSEDENINSPQDLTGVGSSPGDTPAIAANCEKARDVKGCTAKFVEKFLLQNFDTYNFSTKGKLHKTVIHFTITEEGKVTNITAEGDHKRLNKKGIQALRSLPDFIPATKDGKKVSTTFSMPISIKSSK